MFACKLTSVSVHVNQARSPVYAGKGQRLGLVKRPSFAKFAEEAVRLEKIQP